MRALVAMLVWCAAAAAAADDVSRRLEAALTGPALRGARVGALVTTVAGNVVFARGEHELLAPASNQKVLTALAALAAFGPAHRFTTSLYAETAPNARGEVAALYVRGGGDPALTSEEWWRLAADLRRAGVQRVTGDLVIDDTLFDEQRWHPAWGDVTARAYHPAVGALTANYGSFTVEVLPPAPGQTAARILVDPPIPYLRVVSSPQRSNGALQVDRVAAGDGEQVVVRGTPRAASEGQVFHRSVVDPLQYAGAVLRMQLEANGIGVGGRVRRGTVPGQATELLAFRGKSLAEIVRLLMKYSNNCIAETVLKGLAVRRGVAPGTWPEGISALSAELAALGIDTSGLTLLDGSGLAAGNRVTSRTLVEALRVARRSFDYGPEFVAALPIAATDGTLERRAGGIAGAVRAKTGLLSGVVGLSGYARRRSGDEVVFSLLVNGYRSGDAEAMAAVDAFAAALIGSN